MGLNRSGAPPMMARAMGRPSVAARTTDLGVPPTAIHTGIGACRGLGYTARSSMAGRWRPDHVTRSDSRSCRSSSSFSENSSS